MLRAQIRVVTSSAAAGQPRYRLHISARSNSLASGAAWECNSQCMMGSFHIYQRVATLPGSGTIPNASLLQFQTDPPPARRRL